MVELLEELSKIDEIKWIRFLYSYPEGITDELINVVAKNSKIAKYFDIPIQHISDDSFKKMNRRTNKKDIEKFTRKNTVQDTRCCFKNKLIVGFQERQKTILMNY